MKPNLPRFGSFLLLLQLCWIIQFSRAEVVTYLWPTGPGEGVASDRYAVRITVGGETEELKVLMSEGWDDAGGGPDVFRDRTISWANISSDFSEPVVVEVEKLWGEGTQDIEVFPSGYNVTRKPSVDGKKVTFALKDALYLSINFKTADNQHTNDGVISHSMLFFADPLEENVPDKDAPGVHVFTNQSTPADIAAADTVFFEPGFYDLRNTLVYNHEDDLGLIFPQPNQTIYISGGAFLVGRIFNTVSTNNLSIRGRGALSGRAFDWDPNNKTRYDGHREASLIEVRGSNIEVERIFAFHNNMHGIVPGPSAKMSNVKLWGWHYNNDGFRPWGGTVDHCFIRAADDSFYVGGSMLTVTNTVVWQSFNGAVVTCGWGSPTNPYNTSGFLMKDCHILYPEWNGIGNNNGIIASQLPYNATSTNITLENVRIDGNVSCVTNLKRNEAQEITGTAGGITNITFKNVVITGTQVTYNSNRTTQNSSKSRIRGEQGFRIENVTFDNLQISGTVVTEANKGDFFEIDGATTSGITFINTQPDPSHSDVESETSLTTGPIQFARFFGEFGSFYKAEYSSNLVDWERSSQTYIGNDKEIEIPLLDFTSNNPFFVRFVDEY